jgi:hypothetical protein
MIRIHFESQFKKNLISYDRSNKLSASFHIVPTLSINNGLRQPETLILHK